MGREPDWATLDELAAAIAEQLGPVRLVAATDGNHGRAVARMARLLGSSATILVPEGTAAARIDGIASEGAEVVVLPGTYDDAVTLSAGMAGERDLVVSDTSWPGYQDVPGWVIEGYSTIFAEIEAQGGPDGRAGRGRRGRRVEVTDTAPAAGRGRRGGGAAGGGGAGASAGSCLRAGRDPGNGPLLIGVEPTTAACVAAAVEAGHLVEVPGPHRSIMAGLNCGLASMLALPTVAAAFDAFLAVDDDRCRPSNPRPGGRRHGRGRDRRCRTGRPDGGGRRAPRPSCPSRSTATVLLLATEGVTDPANFERIVGRPPR